MGLSRRRFLLRSAGVAGAAAAGGGVLAARDGHAALPPDPVAVARTTLGDRLAFDGQHQAGILTPPGDHAVVAALDVVAGDRAGLIQGLQALSARARQLTRGGAMPEQEPDEPPADSGTLGTEVAPDALAVTIAFGASLFDERFGLAHRRPRRLVDMTAFPDDDLDPARCHGDLLLQLSARRRDTVVHALRELMRPVRGTLALRWSLNGFLGSDRGPRATSARRNLFGFRDGTGNPPVDDVELMNRLVWVPRGGGEPGWAAGGTYQVVRAIRMHLEFWDRVGLREQETMIGRRRDTGAPLGGTQEREDPRLDLDPDGKRIPLDAHMRLANPRTVATDDQRIVRRGWSYDRGFDAAGQLDQGLIFVAFNQDLRRQFETIQRRLAGEPMTDYVTPVGGGYFFAPRGSRGPGDWVGSGLFA